MQIKLTMAVGFNLSIHNVGVSHPSTEHVKKIHVLCACGIKLAIFDSFL